MDVAALLFFLLTVLLSACLVAALVALRSARASRSTPEKKPPTRSLSESCEMLISASELEKLQAQMSRLENRLRMREVRAGSAPANVPPAGATKAELYKHYGFKSSGPAFAQHQLELERLNKLQ